MSNHSGAHISDELPRLLTGDATHDVVMEAAEHLRTCPDCQQELVSAVVSHASLRSAHRFAPEVVAPLPVHDEPRSTVARIHGAVEASDDAEDELESDSLPDMTDMFTRVRAEAAQAHVESVGPARGRRGLLAVAAAAVVLAGGGIAAGYAIDGGGSAGHTVALGPWGVGKTSATANIKGDTVTLVAASLPKLPSSKRYEVWLSNATRNKMYSIGFLGDGSSASFTVKHADLNKFSDIEVSVQKAGVLKYSDVSVLRGSYSA